MIAVGEACPVGAVACIPASHGPTGKKPGCLLLVEPTQRARVQVNAGTEISFLECRKGWKKDLEG